MQTAAATDLVNVSKEKFYEVIYALALNVHPHPAPDRERWEMPNRELVGITTPGWKMRGETTYRIRGDLIAKAEGR